MLQFKTNTYPQNTIVFVSMFAKFYLTLSYTWSNKATLKKSLPSVCNYDASVRGL